MQVLIRKGIISQEEAVEIRSEVLTMTEQATPVSATASKSSPEANYIPMPSKLKGLKLYGDARFRYQYENARSQSGNNNDRSRWRYRARFGTDYQFKESAYSVGVRLETGESNDSTNVNYGGFFDKSGDQLGIRLGEVEGETVGFGEYRYHEYESADGLGKDVPVGQKSHPDAALGIDDLLQSQGSGTHQDADNRNEHRNLVGDRLR